jgi:DNA-binding response OmpR family regulator
VLLDLTMPELDGVATFHEIRRLRPDLPVILISGYSEQEASLRLQLPGLAGFVQKPFQPGELVGRIRAVLSS